MPKNRDIFKSTLDKVVEKAAEDGEISEDEQKIIQQVEVDAKKYADILEAAKKDGIITKEEGKILEGFKKKIISRAEEIAKEDGEITQEEQEMIRKISDIIASVYKKY